MAFTEDEIKRSADLKLWVESRIAELEEELARLRETLLVVDSVLRVSSFKSASELTIAEPAKPSVESALAKAEAVTEYTDVRQLKRSSDGMLLANAFISEHSTAIVPASDISLDARTPPFRSFFLNRILEGMKAKDRQLLAQGKLNPSEILNYEVETSDASVRKIVITNYRDKSRLSEIMSSATWCFSRMIEKKST